ncbi:SPAC3H1.10, partial [Symbiodinium sp. CCMP2456]
MWAKACHQFLRIDQGLVWNLAACPSTRCQIASCSWALPSSVGRRSVANTRESGTSAVALSRQLAELARDPVKDTSKKQDAAALCDRLARRLKAESSSFRAQDVIQLASSLQKLRQRNTLLLETMASHILRGMVSFPLFGLCNILNCFARLGYRNHQLMDGVASHTADRANKLSPIDIASLVFAFAELAHQPRNHLLEACAARLQDCYLEVSGPNSAIILNSYARLEECNPDLFKALSRSVVQTEPRSFQVHHLSLVMNAFAKCLVRKSQTMHVLGDILASRTDELSPQNVTNIVHAFSRLSCYNVRLFQNLVTRVSSEDLKAYKLYELGVLCHNLAKLRSGGPTVYSAMFGELARRPAEDWEPKAVAQVLDAMRRRSAFSHEQLLVLLFRCFFSNLDAYPVHPLTQASWCFVELDALNLAKDLCPDMPSDESTQGFPEGRFAMRRIFERLEDLNAHNTFTPTQRCHVQQLIRAYRYRFELDYGLMPQKVKSFCKSQFDISNSVAPALEHLRQTLL